MAIYYAYGNALVSGDERSAKAAQGTFLAFEKQLLDRTPKAHLEFMSGAATTENVLTSFLGTNDKPIGFMPIAIGKPLSVQIRHIYTGNKAEGFWGNKDMLVASAMKSITTYEGAPRAVNFLVEQTANNQNFRAVDATDKGTPLVCYSPALPQSSSVVTVEVIFSGFPKDAFDAVSQAFSASAGVPVFAPVSGYLVAAGIVTKLLGGVGKSLWDGTPALKRLEEITFVTPGSQQATAHFALLISGAVPPSVLKDYKVGPTGALVRVDDEKRLYSGDEPYVVISIDGRANDDWNNFAPTAASAAQLDKFYNINDGSSQPLSVLVDALKLYNDMTFREKALPLLEKLKKMEKDGVDENSDEYKEIKALSDAYLKNIGTKELKPA